MGPSYGDESRSARTLVARRPLEGRSGDLEEFPGMPDTQGTAFTVNCPVPVLAPNDFRPA